MGADVNKLIKNKMLKICENKEMYMQKKKKNHTIWTANKILRVNSSNLELNSISIHSQIPSLLLCIRFPSKVGLFFR